MLSFDNIFDSSPVLEEQRVESMHDTTAKPTNTYNIRSKFERKSDLDAVADSIDLIFGEKTYEDCVGNCHTKGGHLLVSSTHCPPSNSMVNHEHKLNTGNSAAKESRQVENTKQPQLVSATTFEKSYKISNERTFNAMNVNDVYTPSPSPKQNILEFQWTPRCRPVFGRMVRSVTLRNYFAAQTATKISRAILSTPST